MSFDRRIYKRSENRFCDAEISEDGKKWLPTVLYDLSSGGMKVDTTLDCPVGAVLKAHLVIRNVLREFDIRTDARVRRKEVYDGKFSYGLSFQNLKTDDIIHIDECIRAMMPKMLD